MSRALYLDTARLGLMSLSAQQLQINFARLAGDPHGLLYFSEFLSQGGRACPEDWRTRFPGLDAWRGAVGFSASVRRLVGASLDDEVLFASRSATLMQLAAEQVAGFCRRVLTVDLLWPPYRRIMAKACRQACVSLVVTPLRASALFADATTDELAAAVCRAYREQGCDGLVLPLIDHRGITVPVAEIATRLRSIGCQPKQVIVDASQTLGHVPIDVTTLGCDWLIGGAHKWIGGYHPLGIGVGVAAPRTSVDVRSLVSSDPLLRLIQESAGRTTARHGETAAILPLLTAAGAIDDIERQPVEHRLAVRLANRHRLAHALEEVDWRPLRLRTEHHGILVARPATEWLGNPNANLRDTFAGLGIAATSYANGLVRFSLPDRPFDDEDVAKLSLAFASYRPRVSASSHRRSTAFSRAGNGVVQVRRTER